MLKLHLALLLILLVNSGVNALWCWQCKGPGGVCRMQNDTFEQEKEECTGSCVYEPGRPKPGESGWIPIKLYCRPEKMITTCDYYVIFLCDCQFETTAHLCPTGVLSY